jgi:hypothetical protein
MVPLNDKMNSMDSSQKDVIATLGRVEIGVKKLNEWMNLRLDLVIISGFPEIFAEFRGSKFSLLCQGNRDGFSSSAFHRRCDGHGNTLTVILDTKGNIFGGFTPVE